MKVSKRERNLLIMVGIAVLAMVGFNFYYNYNNSDSLKTSAVDAGDLEEARRLLRSERNLIARQEAVTEALAEIERSFLDVSNPEAAKIEFLQEVENLAGAIGLAVDQKNLLQLEQDVIGVALEGSTDPATLIKFLHGAATNRLGMNLKRLQIHANQKTKDLKYQLIIQLLLVDKKAGR